MIDVSSFDSEPSFHVSGEQLQMLESSSTAYEARISSLTQELKELRGNLQERETIISRLRVDLRDAGERANVRTILNFEFYPHPTPHTYGITRIQRIN